jgi:hypothetical protein
MRLQTVSDLHDDRPELSVGSKNHAQETFSWGIIATASKRLEWAPSMSRKCSSSLRTNYYSEQFLRVTRARQWPVTTISHAPRSGRLTSFVRKIQSEIGLQIEESFKSLGNESKLWVDARDFVRACNMSLNCFAPNAFLGGFAVMELTTQAPELEVNELAIAWSHFWWRSSNSLGSMIGIPCICENATLLLCQELAHGWLNWIRDSPQKPATWWRNEWMDGKTTVKWLQSCKYGSEMNPFVLDWRRTEAINVCMVGKEIHDH